MTEGSSGAKPQPLATPAVHSIERFVFSVPDLAVARHFYEAFGLDVRQNGNRLDIHTFAHPHCWAHIYQGGARKQIQYVSYGIYTEDFAAFLHRARAYAGEVARHELADAADQRQSIWLRDPDGIATQLVVADKVSPSQKTQPTSMPPTAPAQGAAPKRSQVKPVRPRYLSHVLRFSPDVPRMCAFNTDVLGLRLSDRSGDVIAFMHTPHGSDHHLAAFVKSGGPGLHHSSWDVGSINEVGIGAEQMRIAGYTRGWGVGRHVLGSNYFNYVQDPWGSFCEYSCDIDFVPAGFEWPATDHPGEDSLYVWGPSVPEDFVINAELSDN